MAAQLTLLALAGDGIGPEITTATLSVLKAAGPLMRAQVKLDHGIIGFDALKAEGTTIPDAVIAKAKAADGVLLGPVSHNAYPPVAQGGLNPSGVLRKALELFANERPARTWNGIAAHSSAPFDLVVMRENLEGFYADRNMHLGGGEFMPDADTALAMRKITRQGSMRIARAGFELAQKRSAKKVCAVHKANVMRISDGLFLDCCRSVAQDFPAIAYSEMLVDAGAAHLVRDPAQFDVIVTTNMFGDILSDLASEVSGGLGLAGSLNHGEQHAIAQAQHGSAPDIAGQDRANPTSLILSLAMLLRHRTEARAADAIETSVAHALADPLTRTRDLGGALGTAAFTETLCKLIEASS